MNNSHLQVSVKLKCRLKLKRRKIRKILSMIVILLLSARLTVTTVTTVTDLLNKPSTIQQVKA
jgi:hypothetical protein